MRSCRHGGNGWQLTSVLPHWTPNWQVREPNLVLTKHAPVRIAAYTVPKFQANKRAPCRLSRFDEVADPVLPGNVAAALE
ncbi:MAG: hypothetical protein H0X73_13185 [Chthoniobacterales bacterium]|nr:hypothetical protein [Chthoniobacterales bacterium]